MNYPGSSGYGRAWRDAIVGDIGREAHDIVAGFEDLVARGVADPKRAVIGGWSWGGYNTLLSVGMFPDRWRAAIGGVPVGDYVAGYDQLSPDLQAYDRYLLGGKTPHELPELMAERSPIVYADRVRTPTIVLAGRNDTRCPFEQAMTWVDAVRAAGGEVEVYEYDTGHVSFDVNEVVPADAGDPRLPRSARTRALIRVPAQARHDRPGRPSGGPGRPTCTSSVCPPGPDSEWAGPPIAGAGRSAYGGSLPAGGITCGSGNCSASPTRSRPGHHPRTSRWSTSPTRIPPGHAGARRGGAGATGLRVKHRWSLTPRPRRSDRLRGRGSFRVGFSR